MENLDRVDNDLQDHPDVAQLFPQVGNFDPNHRIEICDPNNPNHRVEIPAAQQIPTPAFVLADVITAINLFRVAFDPLYTVLQAFEDSRNPANFDDIAASLSQSIQDRLQYLHKYEMEAGRRRVLEADVQIIRKEYARLRKSHKEQGDLLARYVARVKRADSVVQAQTSQSVVSFGTLTERDEDGSAIRESGTPTLPSRSAYEDSPSVVMPRREQQPVDRQLVIDVSSCDPTEPSSSGSTSQRASPQIPAQISQIKDPRDQAKAVHSMEFAKLLEAFLTESAQRSAPPTSPQPVPSSRPDETLVHSPETEKSEDQPSGPRRRRNPRRTNRKRQKAAFQGV